MNTLVVVLAEAGVTVVLAPRHTDTHQHCMVNTFRLSLMSVTKCYPKLFKPEGTAIEVVVVAAAGERKEVSTPTEPRHTAVQRLRVRCSINLPSTSATECPRE